MPTISPKDEEPDLDEIIVISSGFSPLGALFIFVGVLVFLIIFILSNTGVI